MGISVRTVDGSAERAVTIAAVVNKSVLAQLSAKWFPNALPSRHCSLIVGWAVEFYQRWRRAPGMAIRDDYEAWVRTSPDPAEVELIGGLLRDLSDEYRRYKEAVNVDYVLDRAHKLMRRVQLVELMNRMELYKENDDIDRAFSEAAAARPVELATDAWIDLADAEAAVVAAFEKQSEVVIQYPDALGNFFGTALERDGFVAFMGPEKRGKSFWLEDLSWTALSQGRRVAYFEAGDLSRDQILRRLGVRAAGRPRLGDAEHDLRIPESIEAPQTRGDPAHVVYDGRRFPQPLTGEQAAAALKRLCPPGAFRLSVHPNSTLTVAAIDAQIEEWARDGWCPDVVAIDYADILAPASAKEEVRHQINTNWKLLRSLSQKYHCLVVTVTQTDAEAYDAELITLKNYSEDKRKYSHVTGMIGINQNAREKAAGIYRLNWVVAREMEYETRRCVYVAGCLAIGRPAICSTF